MKLYKNIYDMNILIEGDVVNQRKTIISMQINYLKIVDLYI